ncbi:MAG: amidohydrolase family protein [Phycisphaerales bacterium]|nr:amidohydrolase family protein [Phycisphaerales bacterium]
MALKHNERLIFRGRLFPDGRPTVIEIADGRIARINQVDALDEPVGTQRWLSPGFCDIQINGFAGRDFCSPDLQPEDVKGIAEAVFKTGTTRFLATIITNSLDTLCHQAATIAEAMDRDPFVRRSCVGIHLEGPFLNPEDGPRGAHPREHIRPPSIPDFERVQEAARGRVALLTLAPEQPGAEALIRHAASKNVIVSLGHHGADWPAITKAVEAGARLCTHLCNGSHATLPRLNNYIWHQLAEDRLWASFIADGHHIPPTTLRSVFRAKTPARAILVTDAISAAGMPPGRHHLGRMEVELTKEHKVVLPETPYLAGSAADMPWTIRHAITDGCVSLADALRMTTINPRALLRRYIQPWTMRPGAEADLVEFLWRAEPDGLSVRQTILGPYSGVNGA